MINIGKGDAKKFVPQSIGRGVRIQPYPNDLSNRKRLDSKDTNKNRLLETLFIFPTDADAVKRILDAMIELGGIHKHKEKTYNLYNSGSIATHKKLPFDLLIPSYTEKHGADAKLPFKISNNSKELFLSMFNEMSPGAFLLQNHISQKNTWTLEQYM